VVREYSGFKKFWKQLRFVTNFKRQFRYALEQAKLAGVILGLFLAHNNIFAGKSLSIIGFSLGTVVASYTCKMV
jgi:hypothetical protein